MSFVVSYGKNTKIVDYVKRELPSPAYILESKNIIIIVDLFDTTEHEILSGGGKKIPIF